ncbi:uncharacterized protein LOC130673837 [Microplitis mediator]|uniref:uncharacterized protein LOC130673837 n=1 Tax=Microplitis mediator TaxID=375433 RepID=UPI0025533693|nr:uncharacterized protein LOC130673837 [Microplitis mediator]
MYYLSRIVGDDPIEDFVGPKFLSVQETLSVYLFHRKNLKLQRRECLLITIDKVREKWSQAEISTCGKDYAVNKLSNLLDKVKNLQKSSKRRHSNTQKQKVSIFGHKLKNLFDIAQLNVEKFINDYQKLFLAGQRSKSRFGLIDYTLKSEEIHEDMIVDCAGEDESNLLLAAQKSGIVQSDSSATTSSQTSNPVSDF